jgi:serine/threonine-protein kinase RsbT
MSIHTIDPFAENGTSADDETETETEIASLVDIVTARQRVKSQALALGFDLADVTLIAAAISEIARNIVDHAGRGEILLRVVVTGDRCGLQIIARDQGPGIPDVARVVEYGESPQRRVGVGLPGVRSLVDEFDIVSAVGLGTTVSMIKWLPE